MKLQFQNGRVLFPDRTFRDNCPVTIEGDRILSVGEFCPADRVVDLSGNYLIPGLLDMHTHGRCGHDFATASGDEMKTMKADYLRHGVTSLFPTLASATPAQWSAAISRIRSAGFAGIHLEGRYLNPKKRGAHAPELLVPPTGEDLLPYLEQIGDLPCHITAALELDSDGSFAKAALNHGATLALGHTGATYDEAMQAVSRGVTCFTHLCNAMPPLHHRDGGAVCAGLLSDAYVELIVDGMHISPEMVSLLYRAKGPDRFVLITDSMEATGCPDGSYSIAGQPVTVRDGRAVTPDGALAGSTLNLWDGVKNLIRFAGASPEDAFTCATRNPARAVGIDAEVGTVEPGKRADLLVVSHSLEILSIYKNGVCC